MPMFIPLFVPEGRFADRFNRREVGDPPLPSHLHGLTMTVPPHLAVASMPGSRSVPQRSGTQIADMIPVVNLDHLSLMD
jgi:hypothetical protein